jgi:plastocyanin
VVTSIPQADVQVASAKAATDIDLTVANNQTLMHPGPVSSQSAQAQAAPVVTGMTQEDVQAIDLAAATGLGGTVPPEIPKDKKPTVISNTMHDMPMHMTITRVRTAVQSAFVPPLSASASHGPRELNGCLTLLADGRAMLRVSPMNKIYRVEGQPLLFSWKANRLVHVTGELGSVVADEDPNIPSFVVATIDELASSCSVKITPALLRKALAKDSGPGTDPLTIGMRGMSFFPAKIVVKVGQKVTWKDSTEAIHNVVDDAAKAANREDVHVPAGAKPFDSGWMQPGQAFSHVFTTPGVYRYACTLHEGYGMQGTVVVK